MTMEKVYSAYIGYVRLARVAQCVLKGCELTLNAVDTTNRWYVRYIVMPQHNIVTNELMMPPHACLFLV